VYDRPLFAVNLISGDAAAARNGDREMRWSAKPTLKTKVDKEMKEIGTKRTEPAKY
jgi:hypothetical protein